MKDVLETVKTLRALTDESHPIASVEMAIPAPYPDHLIHMHIETQTYLLAEILKELRKANNPVWNVLRDEIGQRELAALLAQVRKKRDGKDNR